MRCGLFCCMAAGLAILVSSADTVLADPKISFNRDIRPILSENCFECHGPDANQRQAELRLDQAADALEWAITPGDLNSPLIERIATDELTSVMPPPNSKKSLSPAQIAKLTRWVEQGANYEPHWSLLPIVRPEVPEVAGATNPIDAFVRQRLRTEGLAAAPEAERRVLLRRVTLDLIGLPPTPQEIDAFLADAAPGAYERVVDRLLASPHYGEQMALPWLEAARYADTSGYQADWERFMWPWRDWVIQAFNDNMPFDQFTVEQLAGDLLPNATPSQILATGFNRNHRINDEGGVIAAEYAVEYVVDRVDTTSTVWLGLTMGCCRCHDHKYDPLSQQDFYNLFAIFNNVPEAGKDGRLGYAKPTLQYPNPETEEQLARLASNRAAKREALTAAVRQARPNHAAWLTALSETFGAPGSWKSVWSVLSFDDRNGSEGVTLEALPDGSLLSGGANPKRSHYRVSGPAPPPSLLSGPVTGVSSRSAYPRYLDGKRVGS